MGKHNREKVAAENDSGLYEIRIMQKPGQAKPKRKKMPLVFVVLIDFLIFSAALIVFMLFHHVFPRASDTEEIELPNAVETQAAESEAPAGPSEEPTGADATPAVTTPAASPGATPSAVAETGWGAKFPGVFTDGEIISEENLYKSKNISIEILKKAVKVDKENIKYHDKAVCFVADIYVRDLKYFRTALAGKKFGTGKAPVEEIAKANNGLLAITGDNCTGTSSRTGPVVRNGKLLRTKPFEDVLVMNNDGSMETFSEKNFDIEKIKKTGAYQVWSFGPMLLKNGQPMEKFVSRVEEENPRAAIGYYEPGHYCFVLVDGRRGGYSNGMTLKELSQLMYDLGCKVAYNLDGGESAVLVFKDKVVNRPFQDGRSISDIVYIRDEVEP